MDAFQSPTAEWRKDSYKRRRSTARCQRQIPTSAFQVASDTSQRRLQPPYIYNDSVVSISLYMCLRPFQAALLSSTISPSVGRIVPAYVACPDVGLGAAELRQCKPVWPSSIQSVLDAVVRLICGVCLSDHDMRLIDEPHWPLVSSRIQYELARLWRSAASMFSPPLYLVGQLPILMTPPRSSRKSIGDRTFPAAAADLWSGSHPLSP